MITRCQIVTIKFQKWETGEWLFAVALALLLFCGCTPHGPRELLQGQKLLERGKYPQARKKLAEATELLKTNAQAWNYLGVACQHAVEPIEAEKAYQRALLIDHDLSEAHFNLGCLYLEQNRPASAKSELMAFSLRRGNSLEGLLMLGLAELRSRDGAAAEKSFSEALRLSPENPEALNGLGLARLQRGRAAEAAASFTSAIRKYPNYRPAIFNAAVVQRAYLKDSRTALDNFKQYLSLKPAPVDASAVKEEMRSMELELNPPPVPKPIVAVTNRPNPQTPSIVSRTTTQAVASSPAQPAVPSPAAPTVKRYLYRNPPRPSAGNKTVAQKFFLQGSQAQQARRAAEAVAAYRGAVQADPANYDAWFNLALIASEAGNLNEALVDYEYALAIRPDASDARYNFALLLRQANYPADAVSELEKLLARTPTEPRAHLVLGSIYADQLQDTGKARQHYTRLLEVDPRNLQATSVRSWLSNHPN